MSQEANADVAAAAPAASGRLMSLDALRGFDMFWIVGAEALLHGFKALDNNAIVRFIGKQLEHKDWEGFAFEDLIFPMFLFMVGVSAVFSLDKAIEKEGRGAALRRVFVRGVVLYLLGIFFYGGFSNEWPDIRMVGVLNRLAVGYFFTGLLYCFFRYKGLLASLVVILVSYWAMMTFYPTPGIGAGIFEKGKNLANWFDSVYLPGRAYDGTWDPEGLLSMIPAVGTCIIGALCGMFLKEKQFSGERKSAMLFATGIVVVGLGFLWGMQFPVIKKIWTSSYVLVAGGYSMMFLGTFYYIIDVRNHQKWCLPFVWIGTNALTIYMATHIFGFDKLAKRLAGGDFKHFMDVMITKGMGDMVLAIVEMALVFLFCRFLYNRKIFIRV